MKKFIETFLLFGLLIFALESCNNSENTKLTETSLAGVYTPNTESNMGCASITLQKMCDDYVCTMLYVGASGSSMQSRIYKLDGNNLISPDRPNIAIVSGHLTFEGTQYYLDKTQSKALESEQICFVGDFKSKYASISVSPMYDQFDISYNRNNKHVASYEFTDFTNEGFIAYNDKLEQSISVKLINNNSVEINGELFNRATDGITTSEEENAAKLPLYATVISNRAYFFDSPNGNQRTSFLVSNDRIQAIQEQDGYFYTIYTSPSGIITKGWLNKTDLNYSNDKSLSNDLSYLRDLKVDILEHPSFKPRLLRLLGNDFETLQDICCTYTPSEIIGNFYKLFTCETHNCGASNYIILADLAINIVYVGIRKDDKVRTYSENGKNCTLLSEWANGN